ncbi:FecR domain-containing protein [Niabella yanshanensis]|uniref:FecR domain-containing protein n=1 Tax=Niabella yanshanensis TaxID=577386 RepID=A0ABZ0W7D3_9BACT|nr:FecR domain-containing protein [Niabella yanshanensis]WQD38025.1 FecR domain-containing protein [Niabella yanshanensis]
MQQERFIELLTKKLSGEITLSEQMELSRWVEANPGDATLEAQLSELISNDSLPVHSSKQLAKREQNWNRLHQLMEVDPDPIVIIRKPAKIKFMLKWVAAASILLFAIFVTTQRQTGKDKPDLNNNNIVATKKGSKSNLVLPDGSKVWINSDSKISYKDGFGKTHRTLTLTGEAYFDVVKDPDRPFLIHTPELDVKVLGTAFNVRSYPDESNTTTTLVRGSLQVKLNKHEQQVYVLKPDEKLIVDKEPLQLSKEHPGNAEDGIVKLKIIKTDSIPPEAQWTNNALVFENKRLDEIAIILSRWYGVQVIIDSSRKIKAETFTGFYDNESLQNVLESLKIYMGFRYKIENNTVLIEP